MDSSMAYFESSVFLSVLLEDTGYEEAREVWNLPCERVTSILTPIEVVTVIRRFYGQMKPAAARGLRSMERRAGEVFNEVSVLNVDHDIRNLIELKREFSQCRSLDAIHVASGYYLAQSMPGQSFGFYSFDRRVNDVARKVGLKPRFA